MRKKLCCIMSAVLALSICVPGGAMQALAADGGGQVSTSATAPQEPAASGQAVDESQAPSAVAQEQGEQEAASDPGKASQVVPAPADEKASGEAMQANGTRGSPTEEPPADVPAAAKAPLRAPAAAKQVDASITKFEIQNLNGQTADKVFYSDTFYIAMDWDASQNGANLHEGDYFDITLPDNMKFPSGTTATNFNIYGSDGTTVIATAHVSPGADDKGGTVRVTFTDWVEGKENVKGSIRLAAQFDRESVQQNGSNSFSIVVNGQVTTVTTEVTGPKDLEDELLSKWGGSVTGETEQARWTARINHEKATLSNVVISDHLSEGTGSETYIEDSFVLTRVEFDSKGYVITTLETVDLSDKLTVSSDKRSFTIDLGNVDQDQYRLTYRTTYVPGTTLRNNMELTSTEQSKTYTATHISADSGGSGAGDLANKIKLIKVDAEDTSVQLANATFEVTAPDGSTFTLTTGDDGTVTSGSLTSGTYKVREIIAPVGYELDDQEYTLTVNSAGGALQTITDEPVKTSVDVTKSWVGPEGGDVTVRLLADNADTGKTATLSAAGGWTGSFDGLRKFDVNDGHEIVYTVSEDPVANYDSTVSGDAASGFTITNTNTETVAIEGAKTWDDGGDRDGVRPQSITIRLHADGAEVSSTTVTAADNWSWLFDGQPKYDAADGHEVAYTVTEDAVPGYATTVSGFDVTNVYTPGKTSVTVTEAWDDGDDQDGMRPDSIQVQLYANGTASGDPVTLDEGNQWTHTWTGLFQKEGGRDVAYTVGELDAPAGYTSAVSGDATAGFTVTNSHAPEVVSVPVAKTWVGGEAGSVTIHLLADGVDTGKTLTLTADGGWNGSFEGLSKYKDHGTEIAYTISEDAVSGYTSQISGDAKGGFTVTNTKDEIPGKPGGPSQGKRGGNSFLPKTGDDTVAPIALLAAALAAGAAGLIARRRMTAEPDDSAAGRARHSRR